jgi:hypothetical protein
MKVLYRISEAGYAKRKPYYVNPRNILEHFLKVFQGHDIVVIADNVSDSLYEFIKARVPTCIRTSLSNAGAFMYAVQYAIDHFNDSDKVYFAEDDYIYTRNAPKIIEEGLTIAQYSSGYDHPDKYINHKEGGPNPYIAEGGELSRVVVTASSHWKFTNSCCMTFATTVKTVKEDLDVYKKHCSTRHPYDFQLFQELILNRNRKLVSPLPSVSTHGETMWLAKFIDWEKEIKNSSSNHFDYSV